MIWRLPDSRTSGTMCASVCLVVCACVCAYVSVGVLLCRTVRARGNVDCYRSTLVAVTTFWSGYGYWRDAGMAKIRMPQSVQRRLDQRRQRKKKEEEGAGQDGSSKGGSGKGGADQ